MDTVDTPFWPGVMDFVKPDRTIPWRDLQHDIFRIVQTYDLGKGKFGPSVVLELEKKVVRYTSLGHHLLLFLLCDRGSKQSSSSILV